MTYIHACILSPARRASRMLSANNDNDDNDDNDNDNDNNNNNNNDNDNVMQGGQAECCPRGPLERSVRALAARKCMYVCVHIYIYI